MIIDGAWLSKHIFYCMLPEIFKHKYFCGGDYVDFAVRVRAFFGLLARCKVEPIVIFDGCSKIGLEPSVRLKNIQWQFNNRLVKTVQICESGNAHLVKYRTHWPSLTTVMFQVMLDLNIVYLQCVTRELDDIIPVIARYYRCPVLALDSDFLLWDLPGGVISMYKFFEMYDKLSSDDSLDYIECSIYYRENGLLAHLESSYGFKREMLPLVGPLLAYAHVDREIANRFAGIASRDQLSRLMTSLELRISSALAKFASSHFESSNDKCIADQFIQSTLENLRKSFQHFSSISERELQKVEQNFADKLDEITSKWPLAFSLTQKCYLHQQANVSLIM